MGMRRSSWAAGVTVVAATFLFAVPQLATAEEVAESASPQLTAPTAVKLMRTVLLREFGDAWTEARGHSLGCPVAVHPERGGAGQVSEIRRRCYFEWSVAKTRYSGRGLIWLGGARADGSRHWSFQFKSFAQTGNRVTTFNQSGSVRND